MTSREESPEASRTSRASSAVPRDVSPAGTSFDTSVVEPGSSHGAKRKSKAGASASGAAGAGSSFSGVGKIRHLKKEDGEPLWRRDIQYDFLRAVFDDDSKVFTNNYEKGKSQKQNFADLYIDTMARSSKTSKVLRDKLLSDREAAKGMAMVCLLVNVGRMNTTLNCMALSLFLSPSPVVVILSAADTNSSSRLQSSPKCEPSSEHIMLSPHCKPTKMPLPISSCRMPQD